MLDASSGPRLTLLATETLTFLFTDMEGSRALLRRLSRWHNFDPIALGSIGKILEEVERDQTNILWG